MPHTVILRPMSLVEITPETHGVTLEIVYAGSKNFTDVPIYGRAACYLLDEAEPLLVRAVEFAAELKLGLKIFDAFRPSEAQWAMWTHTPDPNFLADPRRGSPHSRGVAVDLTLTDAGGRELEMGTAFDTFSPRSHHGNTGVSTEAQKNRHLLLGLMTAAGWDFYRNEWWHYQMFDSRRFEALSDNVLPVPMMP